MCAAELLEHGDERLQRRLLADGVVDARELLTLQGLYNVVHDAGVIVIEDVAGA